MNRSAWRQTQRNLYFIQRTMGDISAAQRGTLVRRLVRRKVTRSGIGPILNAVFRALR